MALVTAPTLKGTPPNLATLHSMLMTPKLTSMIASVLLTGSVALAFLPAPSPLPTSPSLAVSAAMAPVTPDDCTDACRDAADEAVEDALDDHQVCGDSAWAGHQIASLLCDQIEDPVQQALCQALADAALTQSLDVCDADRDARFAEILKELNECLAACA